MSNKGLTVHWERDFKALCGVKPRPYLAVNLSIFACDVTCRACRRIMKKFARKEIYNSGGMPASFQ